MHLFGGHAPYTLKEGDWDDAARTRSSDTCSRVMDEHAPGFSDGIIDMQVLMPPDIERIIGSPHGHIFHGELQVGPALLGEAGAALRGLSNARSTTSTSAAPRPIRAVGLAPWSATTPPREILKDLRR